MKTPCVHSAGPNEGHRRGWLVFALATACFAPPLTIAAERRPNILWITCEDMSPDLACYGDTYAVTPRLDDLASRGTRFTRVFSHAGVCAPSRSGLITGMYPTTLGTCHMRCQGVPPPYVRCFPEYLRAAGYYCTNNVKTDYNFPAPQTAWDENSPQADWRGRDAGQPFFCVINFTTSHESQVRAGDSQFAERTRQVPAAARHDPARATLPPYYPDAPAVRRDWARYHDLITAVDVQVGEVLDRLAADGLAEETVVFFFSDHGRGLPRAKRWLYDSGLQVPLIVRWPGQLLPGSVEERLVAFVDFAPTVLALAEVPRPQHLQGQVFLGPQTAPPREYVFAARDRMDERYDRIRAVRDVRYKYLRNYCPEKPYAQTIAFAEEMPTLREWRRRAKAGQLTGPQKLFFQATKPREELYDTLVDPHEIHNLADAPEHAATLIRLRLAHAAWTRCTGDLGQVPETQLAQWQRPHGIWQTAAAPELTTRRDVHGFWLELSCPTQGASLAYTWDEGPGAKWHLYHQRLARPAGGTLRAKACRLGFRESPELVHVLAAGEAKN